MTKTAAKGKIIFGITAPQSVDMLHGQLNFFFEKGYDVFLLGPDDKRTREFCIKENSRFLPVSIKREISPFWDVVSFFQILFHLIKVKPDVVNLGTPKMSFLGMTASKLARIPLRVFTYRGLRYEPEKGFKRKLLMYMEHTSASLAHRVFCISKSLRDKAVEDGVLIKNNHFTIRRGSSNGIDLNLFNPGKIDRSRVIELNAKYKLKDNFVFGFTGRLVDRKGIMEIYSAFDSLYKKNPEIRLLMVGRPNYPQISDPAILEKYKSHPGIVMTGLQPFVDIPYFMSLMDVFVMPGWGEGFGAVYLQAAAMGCPVISANSTGCKDAVSHEYNGFLIEPGNTERLEHYMQHYLKNPDLLEQHSRNSLEWVKEFKPEIIWEGLYDEIETAQKMTFPG